MGERELLEEAARWRGHPDLASLTGEALAELSRARGVDFATALLYDRYLRSPEHGPFIRRLREVRDSPAFGRAPEAAVVVVPGAQYVEKPHTGADGRLIREEAERLGCATGLVPLESNGSLRANARALCRWLTECPFERVILASISKGGSDVKLALGEPDAARAFSRVAAWINVGGILRGSPVSDWMLDDPIVGLFYRSVTYLQGKPIDFVSDLRRGPGNPLAAALRLPAGLPVVSLAGFPLEAHLENFLSRRCHRLCAPLGPNDGLIVLGDEGALPGRVYPVWGSDHYMRPEATARAVLGAVLRLLGEELAVAA
ncbi:MAG TPA: hypothetical protein VNI01_04870 [Elusimicrobiota bacterium]|nr:hypothetical protein [Elusimicrobiota bacterium]